jgi:hypothetical protein
MTTLNRSDELFTRGTPPAAPHGLRSKTLERAAAAMAAGATDPASSDDLWDRAWRSRGLRLAWATLVAGLVFGHLWAAERARLEAVEPTYGGLVRSAVASDPELDEVIGFLPLRLVPVPLLGTAAAPSVPIGTESESNHNLENS